jgi:hypothetical protein
LAGSDDLAVGLDRDCEGVPAGGAVGDEAARTEARVEAAVGVVAREREVGLVPPLCGVADDDDLAVGLDRNGLRTPCIKAGQVGGDEAARTKARVEAAIGVVAGEQELSADFVAADHDDLAVRLQRHRRLGAAERSGHLAFGAEAGIEPAGPRRRRPVVIQDRQHGARLRAERRATARCGQRQVHRPVRLAVAVEQDVQLYGARQRVAIGEMHEGAQRRVVHPGRGGAAVGGERGADGPGAPLGARDLDAKQPAGERFLHLGARGGIELQHARRGLRPRRAWRRGGSSRRRWQGPVGRFQAHERHDGAPDVDGITQICTASGLPCPTVVSGRHNLDEDSELFAHPDGRQAHAMCYAVVESCLRMGLAGVQRIIEILSVQSRCTWAMENTSHQARA